MTCRRGRVLAVAAATISCAVAACGGAADGPRSAAAPVDSPPARVSAVRATATLAHDPDDPAIWVHPTEPQRSLILGTVKAAAPDGGLAVFGLDGTLRQFVGGIDRPNNVDVEYGLLLGGRQVDIAVVTERYARRLRIFTIPADGSAIAPLASVPVLVGESGEAGAPMGIGLYRRVGDQSIFAIVAPKTGARDRYLWQYRLLDDGGGQLAATLVRRFGHFSGAGEIEAVAVDDAVGYVYYADEGDGIHKWHADPDHPDAARPLAHFARDGFSGDREGIAVYPATETQGYVIVTDQLPDDSQYRLYRRAGLPNSPHDHSAALGVFSGGADSTDGIEVTSRDLGPEFRRGLLVVMNSSARNFLLFRWEDVESAMRTASASEQ